MDSNWKLLNLWILDKNTILKAIHNGYTDETFKEAPVNPR